MAHRCWLLDTETHWPTQRSGTRKRQGRGLRCLPPPSGRRPSKLIAILAHEDSRRPQPDADFAIGADKAHLAAMPRTTSSAVSGRPAADLRSWRQSCARTARSVKDALAGRSLDHRAGQLQDGAAPVHRGLAIGLGSDAVSPLYNLCSGTAIVVRPVTIPASRRRTRGQGPRAVWQWKKGG